MSQATSKTESGKLDAGLRQLSREIGWSMNYTATFLVVCVILTLIGADDVYKNGPNFGMIGLIGVGTIASILLLIHIVALSKQKLRIYTKMVDVSLRYVDKVMEEELS